MCLSWRELQIILKVVDKKSLPSPGELQTLLECSRNGFRFLKISLQHHQPSYLCGGVAVSAQLGLCKLVALVVKKLPEPACQCRRHKRHRFDPQVGKFPQNRWDNPLQRSCLEKSVDRGTWRATVPGGTLSDLACTGRTQQDNCQHIDGRERPGSYRQEPAVSRRPFIRKIISPEVASPAEEGVGSQRNENKSWRVMAPGRSWTRCWEK